MEPSINTPRHHHRIFTVHTSSATWGSFDLGLGETSDLSSEATRRAHERRQEMIFVNAKFVAMQTLVLAEFMSSMNTPAGIIIASGVILTCLWVYLLFISLVDKTGVLTFAFLPAMNIVFTIGLCIIALLKVFYFHACVDISTVYLSIALFLDDLMSLTEFVPRAALTAAREAKENELIHVAPVDHKHHMRQYRSRSLSRHRPGSGTPSPPPRANGEIDNVRRYIAMSVLSSPDKTSSSSSSSHSPSSSSSVSESSPPPAPPHSSTSAASSADDHLALPPSNQIPTSAPPPPLTLHHSSNKESTRSFLHRSILHVMGLVLSDFVGLFVGALAFVIYIPHSYLVYGLIALPLRHFLYHDEWLEDHLEIHGGPMLQPYRAHAAEIVLRHLTIWGTVAIVGAEFVAVAGVAYGFSNGQC